MSVKELFGENKPPDPGREKAELEEAIRTLSARLDKADVWFRENGTDHPRYAANVHKASQLAKELNGTFGKNGGLLGRAYEMGLYWDGKKLVPWADAFNPAAIANRPPNPNVVEDAVKQFKGKVVTPPHAQPAGGSFSGTVTEDWSDIG